MCRPPKLVIIHYMGWCGRSWNIQLYNLSCCRKQKREGEYKGTFKVTANQLTGYFATKIGNEKADAATPITVDKTGAYYTGSAITIDSFKTKYVLKNNADNKVLTEGKDYELVYTDNVNAGKATVVAYGLGNYAKVDATTGRKKLLLPWLTLSEIKLQLLRIGFRKFLMLNMQVVLL